MECSRSAFGREAIQRQKQSVSVVVRNEIKVYSYHLLIYT